MRHLVAGVALTFTGGVALAGDCPSGLESWRYVVDGDSGDI